MLNEKLLYCYIIIFLTGISGMLFFNVINVNALASCGGHGFHCYISCPANYEEVFVGNSGCIVNTTNKVCCKPKNTTPSNMSEVKSSADPSSVTLNNPLGETNIPTLLGTIIKAVLGIVGSLALVMFIYGGILWMLSAGKQEQVTKGKETLLWATIGIIVIFSAYALVSLVLTALK
ncbi:MAG: pilin [Patescibacteria group bacterium]